MKGAVGVAEVLSIENIEEWTCLASISQVLLLLWGSIARVASVPPGTQALIKLLPRQFEVYH